MRYDDVARAAMIDRAVRAALRAMTDDERRSTLGLTVILTWYDDEPPAAAAARAVITRVQCVTGSNTEPEQRALLDVIRDALTAICNSNDPNGARA